MKIPPELASKNRYDPGRMAEEFAGFIDDNCPDCREKSLAITKLEEVVMWANAGLARGRGEETNE